MDEFRHTTSSAGYGMNAFCPIRGGVRFTPYCK